MLNGKTYNNIDIKDFNKRVDSISIFIIGFAIVVIISTLYFMSKAVREIILKKRNFKEISMKSFVKIGICLIFVVGVTYCIYLIPYILYYGVSWKFVFVWLPNSVKIALYLFYISIWLAYIYALLVRFFKKR